MLIIFDVDGTLIGGESVDWKCFRDAFHQATGEGFRKPGAQHPVEATVTLKNEGGQPVPIFR